MEVSDDSVNDDLAVAQTNYTQDPPEVFGTVRNQMNNSIESITFVPDG